VAFVAVIDDDEQLRTALADLIGSCGMESEGFGSSRDYLESTKVARTNCLVADVQMSGMSGLELYRTLLRDGYQIPVVFITAFPDERVRREAKSLGAVCFLSKPFQIGMLMDCINEALGHRRPPAS